MGVQLADVLFSGAVMLIAWLVNPYLVRYLWRVRDAHLNRLFGEPTAEVAMLEAWALLRTAVLHNSHHVGNKAHEGGICELARQLPQLTANDLVLVNRAQAARNLIVYRGDLASKQADLQELANRITTLAHKLDGSLYFYHGRSAV